MRADRQDRDFYPRPPGGGRLLNTPCRAKSSRISIHALRVEGDIASIMSWTAVTNFYPRPPGGGRPALLRLWICLQIFLSTPSGWRATCKSFATRWAWRKFLSTPSGWRATVRNHRASINNQISIHALRVEGDKPKEYRLLLCQQDFYPRPPGGGRQQKRTKFSSVFAQKGEEFASLRRGKRKICRWRFKKDKFWVLIWCEGSGKSVCASASHCG